MKYITVLVVVIAFAIDYGCHSQEYRKRHRLLRKSTTLNLSQEAKFNFAQKSVGYLVSQEKFGETTPCLTQGNSIYFPGKPVFIDATTGFYDGTVCWVKGVTNETQTEVCYARGTVVSHSFRSNVSESTCVVEGSSGFVIGREYVQGVSAFSLQNINHGTAEHPCSLPSSDYDYVLENVLYGVGTSGYVYGSPCILQGVLMYGNGVICDYPGTASIFVGPQGCILGLACYGQFSSVYIMENKYQQLPEGWAKYAGFSEETLKFTFGNQLHTTWQFADQEIYSNYMVQTVGTIKTPSGDASTLCGLQYSSSNPRFPNFGDGSTGYFDGTSCWVRGVDGFNKEDLCYTKGTIKTVYRKNAPKISCTVTMVGGYDFENNYVPGSYPLENRHCVPNSTIDYLDGTMHYSRGSQGFVDGNDCWIRGMPGCYLRGSTWIEGALKSHQACYLTVDFNFIMGNGYQRSNIFELVPAERQLGGFFYKTVGYLKTDSGAEKTTICFAQGGSIDVGEINFVDNSTGYYDRSNCWIKGTTAEERGESCDVKGNIETKQRGSRQEHSCLVTSITGYSIGAGFTPGAPSRTDSGCQFALTLNEVRGTIVYEHGASGFVQDNDCWIQGIKNGEVCYSQGVKDYIPEATGSPYEACYTVLYLAFSMKNYVMMNIDVAANPSVIFGKTSWSIQQSVGFVKGEGDLLKICHTLGTEIERGFPHYVEGSTGFFDGDKCFVRGKTDFQHGTDCYVPGAVKTMYRNNSLVVVCSKLDVIGAVMEGKYTPGFPYRGSIGVVEPPCSLPSGRTEVNGKISYLRGTSGFFDGTNCWIVGVTTDGHESCHISGITNYGQNSSQWNKPACYVMIDIAYMMATGFENLAVDFGEETVRTLEYDLGLIYEIENRSDLYNNYEKEVKIVSKSDVASRSVNNIDNSYLLDKQRMIEMVNQNVDDSTNVPLSEEQVSVSNGPNGTDTDGESMLNDQESFSENEMPVETGNEDSRENEMKSWDLKADQDQHENDDNQQRSQLQEVNAEDISTTPRPDEESSRPERPKDQDVEEKAKSDNKSDDDQDADDDVQKKDEEENPSTTPQSLSEESTSLETPRDRDIDQERNSDNKIDSDQNTNDDTQEKDEEEDTSATPRSPSKESTSPKAPRNQDVKDKAESEEKNKNNENTNGDTQEKGKKEDTATTPRSRDQESTTTKKPKEQDLVYSDNENGTRKNQTRGPPSENQKNEDPDSSDDDGNSSGFPFPFPKLPTVPKFPRPSGSRDSNDRDEDSRREKRPRCRDSNDRFDDYRRRITPRRGEDRPESRNRKKSRSRGSRRRGNNDRNDETDRDYENYDDQDVEDDNQNEDQPQDYEENDDYRDRNDDYQEEDQVEDTSNSRVRNRAPRRYKQSRHRDTDDNDNDYKRRVNRRRSQKRTKKRKCNPAIPRRATSSGRNSRRRGKNNRGYEPDSDYENYDDQDAENDNQDEDQQQDYEEDDDGRNYDYQDEDYGDDTSSSQSRDGGRRRLQEQDVDQEPDSENEIDDYQDTDYDYQEEDDQDDIPISRPRNRTGRRKQFRYRDTDDDDNDYKRRINRRRSQKRTEPTKKKKCDPTITRRVTSGGRNSRRRGKNDRGYEPDSDYESYDDQDAENDSQDEDQRQEYEEDDYYDAPTTLQSHDQESERPEDPSVDQEANSDEGINNNQDTNKGDEEDSGSSRTLDGDSRGSLGPSDQDVIQETNGQNINDYNQEEGYEEDNSYSRPLDGDSRDSLGSSDQDLDEETNSDNEINYQDPNNGIQEEGEEENTPATPRLRRRGSRRPKRPRGQAKSPNYNSGHKGYQNGRKSLRRKQSSSTNTGKVTSSRPTGTRGTSSRVKVSRRRKQPRRQGTYGGVNGYRRRTTRTKILKPTRRIKSKLSSSQTRRSQTRTTVRRRRLRLRTRRIRELDELIASNNGRNESMLRSNENVQSQEGKGADDVDGSLKISQSYETRTQNQESDGGSDANNKFKHYQLSMVTSSFGEVFKNLTGLEYGR